MEQVIYPKNFRLFRFSAGDNDIYFLPIPFVVICPMVIWEKQPILNNHRTKPV